MLTIHLYHRLSFIKCYYLLLQDAGVPPEVIEYLNSQRRRYVDHFQTRPFDKPPYMPDSMWKLFQQRDNIVIEMLRTKIRTEELKPMIKAMKGELKDAVEEGIRNGTMNTSMYSGSVDGGEPHMKLLN